MKEKPFIGAIVARFAGAFGPLKFHRVESLIEDDVITRCGRRLQEQTKKGYEIFVIRRRSENDIGDNEWCLRCR